MCGIGGVISRKSFDYETALICDRLLASLVRRGNDSWGFYDVVRLYKEPGSYLDSDYPLITTLLNDRTNLFLCHTRKATVGNPKKNENNHPFSLDSLVLSHNGVLYWYEKFENPWGIETDSFAILYWINEEYKKTRNIVEAIDKGLKHVIGNYACWLYNRDDGKTYLFRNENSLMGTVFLYREDLALFASDKKAISDALGILKFLAIPVVIAPYVIYVFDENGIAPVGHFIPLPVPLEFDLEYTRRNRDLLVYHE